ncbi:methyltransferase-like protein 27 [Antedon mediterranea]|uniref:methyltransferase-like protein 27 n=1 Tax=Antedon mediterranea TaxID=105859 RepID=UPI003AF4C7F2
MAMAESGWTKEKTVEFIAIQKDMDTKEKLGQYFDEWAPNYDQAVTSMGYIGPSLTANLLQKYVKSKDARIFDVASGTGLVGEVLAGSGYTNIDAVDGSAASIEVARKKNIYTNLYVQWLGGDNKLNINNDSYDAIICVGAFAFNQLESDVLPEFIRVVKPGGYILINMRTRWLRLVSQFSDGKLEGDMAKLENEGKWKLVERHVKEEKDSEQNVVTFIHQIC